MLREIIYLRHHQNTILSSLRELDVHNIIIRVMELEGGLISVAVVQQVENFQQENFPLPNQVHQLKKRLLVIVPRDRYHNKT
jgi:hypothetical protein